MLPLGSPWDHPHTHTSVVTLMTSPRQDSKSGMDASNGRVGAGTTGSAGSCEGLLWFSWWEVRPSTLPRSAKADSFPWMGKITRYPYYKS